MADFKKYLIITDAQVSVFADLLTKLRIDSGPEFLNSASYYYYCRTKARESGVAYPVACRQSRQARHVTTRT